MANKTQFLTIFGPCLWIVLGFSIAPYPVWVCCMLHDATIDILFGTERKVYNNDAITFLSIY